MNQPYPITNLNQLMEFYDHNSDDEEDTLFDLARENALIASMETYQPTVSEGISEETREQFFKCLICTVVSDPSSDLRHRNIETTERCILCMGSFEAGEECMTLPCGCNTIFHKDCLSDCLSSYHTCPTCRQNLSDGIGFVRIIDKIRRPEDLKTLNEILDDSNDDSNDDFSFDLSVVLTIFQDNQFIKDIFLAAGFQNDSKMGENIIYVVDDEMNQKFKKELTRKIATI